MVSFIFPRIIFRGTINNFVYVEIYFFLKARPKKFEGKNYVTSL